MAQFLFLRGARRIATDPRRREEADRQFAGAWPPIAWRESASARARITGGENVSSIEVENRLHGHPGVAEVAVIGVPYGRWGETVKAAVVRANGARVTEAELIAYARAGFAHYKCPISVDVVSALPRTVTGKVQKFRLREPCWDRRDRMVA